MNLKHEVRRLARKAGYDVSPFNAKWHPAARRGRLMTFLQIDVVLDVGANTGQYAHELRSDLGFDGRIYSFEPTSAAFRTLQARAAGDAEWTTFNFALGDVAGRTTINLAENSESSSMLEMLPAHLSAEPESRFVSTEDIEIKTLDAIFEEVCRPGERVYLKIDTQGFEGRVLRGAEGSLDKIDTIQLEMSLAPLYDGQSSFSELVELLLSKRYTIVGLEPGFSDPLTGRLLQADAIFHREA